MDNKNVFLLISLITALPAFAAMPVSIPATNITSQCSCTTTNGQIVGCQAVPAARMVAFDIQDPDGNFVNGPIAAPVDYSETKNTVDAPVINTYGTDAIVTSPPGIGSYTYAAVFPISNFGNVTALSVVLIYDTNWKLETLTPLNSTWINPKTCQYMGPSRIKLIKSNKHEHA